MSTAVYKWIVVYDDGWAEEKVGESPFDFVDRLEDIPVAIIRIALLG